MTHTRAIRHGDIVLSGTIGDIREIEDCIRATKKYSEGVKTLLHKHPIQGEEPSRKFCKYYEVYPDMEVGWDMPSGDAIDLLWGDTIRVNIIFDYDYRDGTASVVVIGGENSLIELLYGIPYLCNYITPNLSDDGNHETVKMVLKNVIQALERDKNNNKSNGHKKGLLDRFLDTITPRSK